MARRLLASLVAASMLTGGGLAYAAGSTTAVAGFYSVTDPRSTLIGSGQVESDTGCEAGDVAVSATIDGLDPATGYAEELTPNGATDPSGFDWTVEVISGPTSWRVNLVCAEMEA